MKYRTRTYYTDAQKALMWERWKEGWTLHQIAQLFNRAHTSVQGILSRTGGIRPPPRSRCAMALTLAEREEISRAWWKANRFVRSLRGSGERHQQSAARSSAMAVKRTIGPPKQTALLGIVRSVPSTANWREHGLGAHRDRQASTAVVAGTDRRLAQAYLSARREPCTCHTRPSTAASSSRRVAP